MSIFIVRNAPDLIARINEGSTASNWLEALERVGAKLMDYGGGKGSVTLKMVLKLDRGVFDVTDQLSEKMPAAPAGRTILYPTPEGRFSFSDPRQISLGLRDASGGDTEFRAGGSAAAFRGG